MVGDSSSCLSSIPLLRIINFYRCIVVTSPTVYNTLEHLKWMPLGPRKKRCVFLVNFEPYRCVLIRNVFVLSLWGVWLYCIVLIFCRCYFSWIAVFLNFVEIINYQYYNNSENFVKIINNFTNAFKFVKIAKFKTLKIGIQYLKSHW